MGGLLCVEYGLYLLEEYFFDFLFKYFNNFDDYWMGVFLSQCVEVKEKVVKQFFVLIRNLIEEGGCFLDVGCGDGVYIKFLVGIGSKVELYGLDMLVMVFCNVFEIGGSWNVVYVDVQYLFFYDSIFDIVILFGVFVYFENFEEGLVEIFCVVCFGGMIGFWIVLLVKGFF